MPRVKRILVPPAPPPMPDRPGRWKLIWRRQRRLIKPTLLGAAALGIVVAFGLIVRGQSRGLPIGERVGNATAELGLRVRRVMIEGIEKTPEVLVRAAVGVSEGNPILGFSLNDARARIEGLPWVRSATVQRRLPDIVLVSVLERSPFAVWQNEGKFVLIDRAGDLVAEQNVGVFAKDLPLVVGLGAPQAVADLMEALKTQKELQARMVAAVRVGQRRWNLRMNNGGDVLLPEGHEVVALARLAQLQSQYAVLDRPLRTIDLRAPDRLVLRSALDKVAADKPTTDKPPDDKPTGDKLPGDKPPAERPDPSRPFGKRPT